MQSTTRSDGGSAARIIYHAPGKSFAWLHKDGSFANFQKALRARLNISRDEPLVIKQIDGDYTLDIETEEEYEAFCHFAKSTPQLHISVNGGLRDRSMAGGVGSASSSTTLLPNPGPQPPAESEDPTSGKRKASQITTDPEATLSATQKRKKRRKVGPDRSTSAVNNSTVATTPSEPREGKGSTSGDSIRDATNTSAVTDPIQPTISATKKKKKRKNAGAAQADSTCAESTEPPAEAATESADTPKPPPAEPSKSKKRKKTVVVELSDVIPFAAGTQEPPSGSTARPLLPKSAAEPSTSTAQGTTKKRLANKKANQSAGPPELVPNTPPAPHPNGVEEPVVSSSITKPKPPNRTTGRTDGLTVVEKEQKQQDPVKKSEQQKTGKPKKSQKSGPAKRIGSPNAPSIQEIMDGVIAAAMQDARKRASTSGTTTDASENLTPPLQGYQKVVTTKPGPTDAPGLNAGSPKGLLDAPAPAPRVVDSDSTTARKNTRTGKPHTASSALPFLPTNRGKPSTRPTAPLPNQKAMQKSSQAGRRSEGGTSSEDEDSVTPRRKPAPISDLGDELDAFLRATTNSSQKSILEDLPSDSEEEEDVEREDVEVDEEDEVPRPKGKGKEQLKVMARAESSSDDSESESVSSGAFATANQAKVNAKVSQTQDVVPSSDVEGDGEPLPHPTKPVDTSTHVVPPASSPSSPGPRMTPISNLKSAGQALSFFNERVLDKPDPIENDSSHAESHKGLPDDTEDPIQDPDTASTPKPKLTRGKKGLENTPSPVSTRRNGAANATQSSLTSPLNSMPPPPSPLPKINGNFTFSQPLDQSTPAPSVSRRKQLASQTTVPETLPRSTWTTLPSQAEKSTQSTDEPAVDELVSSPSENTSKLPKATPIKKPTYAPPVKQIPLFLPDTSQFCVPSSDLPAVEKSSSEEDEDEGDEEGGEEEEKVAPPSQRVLRTSAAGSKTITPYRSLSVLASQRSIFPSTPVEPVGPAPTASQVKAGSDGDDDDDDDEDSGVSESDSDSPQPSHIPKGRVAGARNGNRGKRRGQLSKLPWVP